MFKICTRLWPKARLDVKSVKKTDSLRALLRAGCDFLATSKPNVCVCVRACLQQFEVHSLAYVMSPIRLSSQSPAPVLIFKQLEWEKARTYRKGATKIQDQKKCARSLCV